MAQQALVAVETRQREDRNAAGKIRPPTLHAQAADKLDDSAMPDITPQSVGWRSVEAERRRAAAAGDDAGEGRLVSEAVHLGDDGGGNDRRCRHRYERQRGRDDRLRRGELLGKAVR
jgi:hypothetical protein